MSSVYTKWLCWESRNSTLKTWQAFLVFSLAFHAAVWWGGHQCLPTLSLHSIVISVYSVVTKVPAQQDICAINTFLTSAMAVIISLQWVPNRVQTKEGWATSQSKRRDSADYKSWEETNKKEGFSHCNIHIISHHFGGQFFQWAWLSCLIHCCSEFVKVKVEKLAL